MTTESDTPNGMPTDLLITPIGTELLGVAEEYERSQVTQGHHDETNSVNDFVAYMAQYQGRAVYASNPQECYEALIQVANLALTAAQRIRAAQPFRRF